jgi:biopolymer transport protein ExbD
MAMNRVRKKRDSTVPTDSLSDIAFLLIIFFILTTSIRKLTGVTTEIPAAEQGQAQLEKTPTVVLQGGSLAFNSENVSVEQLRQRLKELKLEAKKPEERVVLLEASGTVNYQRYYEVMAAVSAAHGVIGIITQEQRK